MWPEYAKVSVRHTPVSYNVLHCGKLGQGLLLVVRGSTTQAHVVDFEAIVGLRVKTSRYLCRGPIALEPHSRLLALLLVRWLTQLPTPQQPQSSNQRPFAVYLPQHERCAGVAFSPSIFQSLRNSVKSVAEIMPKHSHGRRRREAKMSKKRTCRRCGLGWVTSEPCPREGRKKYLSTVATPRE